MMQAIPGGAAAQPFVTFHNALGCNFYLRIALELYLKRLLVGGLDRVFEIGRIFRNEGLSRKHNPEFTMLEAYQAYGDYETMMELVQSMICHVAQQVLGTLSIEHKDAENQVTRAIDLSPPWKRVQYKALVRERAGADWFDLSPSARRERALSLGAEIGPNYEDFEVTGAVFEKLIEPTLIQPVFVTHLPKELVPLAKLSPDDPNTVEVFECCINGQEIAPAYSEQNDPLEQRERLEHQAGGEQQKLDDDFLVALEHGMPPAGGMGLGIDRLCMMLLGQESIRDVILFPQLKPSVRDSLPGPLFCGGLWQFSHCLQETETQLLLGRVVILRHFRQIHHVPDRLQVICAAVLVLQIIGVLPHVHAEHRLAFATSHGFAHDRIVLVGGRDDFQFAAVHHEPRPAAESAGAA